MITRSLASSRDHTVPRYFVGDPNFSQQTELDEFSDTGTRWLPWANKSSAVKRYKAKLLSRLCPVPSSPRPDSLRHHSNSPLNCSCASDRRAAEGLSLSVLLEPCTRENSHVLSCHITQLYSAELQSWQVTKGPAAQHPPLATTPTFSHWKQIIMMLQVLDQVQLPKKFLSFTSFFATHPVCYISSLFLLKNSHKEGSPS